MKRIVLTGGPGSGKTVISARLAKDDPDRFVVVPEAATQVYRALNTRWDRLDTEGRRDIQRRIYRLQIEQEERITREYPDQTLLLDRGTLDGAAYWPDGPEKYWEELGTTLERELDRYGLIIWLESCAVLGVYDGDSSNACRFENASEAIENGKLLLELWSAHRYLQKVEAFENLDEKVRTVKELLKEENFHRDTGF